MPKLPTAYLQISVEDLQTELAQLADEGRQIGTIQRTIEKLVAMGPEALAEPSGQIEAGKALDLAQQLPMREDYPYEEPSDLESIRKLRPAGPRWYKPMGPRKLADRIGGAWLGRCAGCLLGKPVEGVKADELHGFLKASRQWPLTGYIRVNPKTKAAREYPNMARRGWSANAQYMPVDDDTNYTTLGIMLGEKHGLEMSPSDIAAAWMQNLPILTTFTAERVAYRNFVLGIDPPMSATYRNPYREWIGAQIRADGLAYLAVGQPELAAELAWRDASISHVKNGIYGEMFMAAMIAAAPHAEDLDDLLRIGLSEIPSTSRLGEEVQTVIAWRGEGLDCDQVIERIHQRWDDHNRHHWCHTNSNAAVCVAALLWGQEDFGRSICLAVQAGFDTDCNGATVGSILGMRLGRSGLDASWTDCLHDTLHTSLVGRNVVKISEIARQTTKLCQTLRTG